MSKFTKITIMMAVTAVLSFGANSESAKSVSSLNVIRQNTCRTIPIPPPQPGNPRMPL
jgi:hypothetical protein